MTNETKSRATATTASPGPSPEPNPSPGDRPHRGVRVSGLDGEEGPKAFYIHIEALPGKENQVVRMLEDILGCVHEEPATGPWYAVRYSQTTFGIFEVFPDLAGRQAHVEGGGGDIFRDVERMNALLAYPAHVHRLDVLMSKEVFARR
ncbi:hypothetical protein MA04_02142 [Alcanivorax balearicus MACL04]|uniref:ABM domain-containing protein n=2 Tax=Alloalcanivorax balearicus TaxID=413232 RepID=A0ABT2QZ89_9GAMM|nr:hypothetical protein [Alloalcanivorax balearicus MACL04]